MRLFRSKTDEPGQKPVQELAQDLMRGWKWFAFVPPEAQQWLARHATLREMPRGRTVYVSGDPATHVYAVISGVFRIYLTSPRGDEITLEEVVPGGWFPHTVPVERPTYVLNCVCQADAVVAAFPQPVLQEFAQRWPGYYRGLYHEFADRATAILGRIELLSLHNLNVRLAVYLLRMARLRGVKQRGGVIWIPADDSQAEVGSRVAGTRQRVNSILNTWSKKGIIESGKEGTRILDLARLTAEAKKSGFELEEYLAGWHGGWQGKK